MIAHIQGRLSQKQPGKAIVDVHGLGYLVFITLGTFYQLPAEGDEVFLHTYTHMRENTLELYGFSSWTEREMFRLLLGVTGCGPRLACNILSGIRPDELAHAIAGDDIPRLVAIPGVGKRIAERLVVELRDKIVSQWMAADAQARDQIEPDVKAIREEAISALINLGYSRKEAEKTVQSALNELKSNNTAPVVLEDVIRLALRNRVEWLQLTR
jgi:Holliday junction DNA helicase RuvA